VVHEMTFVRVFGIADGDQTTLHWRSFNAAI
jgi:hypothetical protein